MSDLDPMSVHRDCLHDRCWRDEPAPCALFEGPVNPAPIAQPREYVVYPTAFRDIPFVDRDAWCLYVHDGGPWGWSVRDFAGGQGNAMNRKGEFIYESRGSKSNRFRRYPLAEALNLARQHIDSHVRNGRTPAQMTTHTTPPSEPAAEAVAGESQGAVA